VEIRVTPVKGTKGKKCDVTFVFKPVKYDPLQKFRVEGASAIPADVVAQVMETYNNDIKDKVPEEHESILTIGMMRNIVEKWFENVR